MNARELHDTIKQCHLHGMAISSDMEETILRALDLFVAVEERGDELVLDLLAAAKLHRLAICYKAAARIVAQDERIKELHLTLDAQANALLKSPLTQDERIKKLEAERDSLKQHAEAMAKLLRALNNRGGLGLDIHKAIDSVVDVYRAAHPKEGA